MPQTRKLTPFILWFLYTSTKLVTFQSFRGTNDNSKLIEVTTKPTNCNSCWFTTDFLRFITNPKCYNNLVSLVIIVWITGFYGQPLRLSYLYEDSLCMARSNIQKKLLLLLLAERITIQLPLFACSVVWYLYDYVNLSLIYDRSGGTQNCVGWKQEFYFHSFFFFPTTLLMLGWVEEVLRSEFNFFILHSWEDIVKHFYWFAFPLSLLRFS